MRRRRDGADYTNELLNVMQNNSINRDRINWVDFRAQVIQRASGAQTIPDLYPAITPALGLLNEHHSFYPAVGAVSGEAELVQRAIAWLRAE